MDLRVRVRCDLSVGVVLLGAGIPERRMDSLRLPGGSRMNQEELHMIALSRFRRAVALTTAAVGTSALLFAAPASAATSAPSTPYAATGCNGRICMHITTPSNGTVSVNAWVRNSGDNFFGHYDLRLPNGAVYHMPIRGDATWTHTKNAYWSKFGAIHGQWCVIGWSYNHPGYTKIGEPCETVS